MQHGRDDGAAVLQRLHDMLLRGAQGVEVGAAAERPRAKQDLCQRGRVRQALQHAVHEAGVPQVLQPRALQTCLSISSHSVTHGLPQDAAAAAQQARAPSSTNVTSGVCIGAVARCSRSMHCMAVQPSVLCRKRMQPGMYGVVAPS